MSFVYPSFLFALAALAIPIIIHLFNFRRFKTIYFSNVRFLKEIKEETSSRSKLKHILVLISRLLALAFLVFAFAQPYIPKDETAIVRGSRAVSVFLDNSFSMDAIGDELSLLQKGKDKAREIADAYGPEDRFQLITNDFLGKHQRLVDKNEFINYINEVEVSPAVRKLSQVKERQMQALDNSKNMIFYYISDFQENITDLEADTLGNYYLVPLMANQQQNVAIDSVWTEAPIQIINQENKLYVRLRNSGDDEVVNSSITLNINGQTKAIGDFSIPENSVVTDTLSFTVNTSGWHKAEVFINDYPITFDDNYYFSFFVPEQINILVLNEDQTDPYFTALSGQEFLNVVSNTATQINYLQFSQYQLIILNQLNTISSGLASEIQQYLSNGGNILVYPSPDANLSSYNAFLNTVNAGNYLSLQQKEQSIGYINMEQGLYQDVFEDMPENILFPKVNKYYQISRQTQSNEETIIALNDRSPFLSKFQYEGGAIYLSAVPPALEFSDLPKHTLFVVTIIQIALSADVNDQLAYTIGQDNNIVVRNINKGSEEVFRISNDQAEFIPQQRSLGSNVILSVSDQIETAGIYELKLPNDSTAQWIAFNYDRTESEINPLSVDQLEDKYPDQVSIIEPTERSLAGVVAELNEGVQLWKLCIIFALIFLGVEVVLLRFFPSV